MEISPYRMTELLKHLIRWLLDQVSYPYHFQTEYCRSTALVIKEISLPTREWAGSPSNYITFIRKKQLPMPREWAGSLSNYFTFIKRNRFQGKIKIHVFFLLHQTQVMCVKGQHITTFSHSFCIHSIKRYGEC